MHNRAVSGRNPHARQSELKDQVRFAHDSLLELNEAVIVESNHIEHLDDRYHLDQHLLIDCLEKCLYRAGTDSCIECTMLFKTM